MRWSPHLVDIFHDNLDHVLSDPGSGRDEFFMVEEEGQLSSLCKERILGSTIALVYRWHNSDARIPDGMIRFEVLKPVTAF